MLVDAFALGVPHKMLKIVPRVAVLDSNGEELEMSRLAKDNEFGAPLALQGAARHTDSYFLMVAADNSNIGAHVGSSTGTTAVGGAPMDVNMNEFVNPFGSFLANYKILAQPAD